MIKDKIRNAKGISLISLAITVVILALIANIIIYNVKDNLKVEKLKGMQNDIANLRDKVASYYVQNGKLPASIPYTNISHIESAGVISDTVDTGNFLVIELSALENLTLNYGEDFEKIKEIPESANEYQNLYIINEASHNIFYVRGITIDNETFYTDYTSEKVDSKAVDLRYVEGVKIPEGFYYVSGTKNTGIVIKSNDNTKEYMWIQNNDMIRKLPNGVQVDTNKQEDFIKSVNAYKGYYKNTSGNDVIYLELEKWSPIYDKEGKYTDKNGNTTYIPEGFQVSEVPGQNTIDDGLVVKDSNQNEWVWIEVPKSIYTTAISSTDYTNIEKDMQTYASSYRNATYTDTWYSEEQHGFASSNDYNNYKNKMLKSVYENGGFYIGRYEVGTINARTSSTTSEAAIIQKDAYPYNFITNKQAQILSNQLATGEKTSSLMFGIQWDLVLKFIETKGGKTQSQLKSDSTTWGNYLNSTFDIIRGQYTATPSIANSWTEVVSSYTKSDSGVLLTTGVTNRNSVLNIYDLAGNMSEWTLEYSADTNSPCVFRGGYNGYAKNEPVYSRTNSDATSSYEDIGFRPALY